MPGALVGGAASAAAVVIENAAISATACFISTSPAWPAGDSGRRRKVTMMPDHCTARAPDGSLAGPICGKCPWRRDEAKVSDPCHRVVTVPR